MPSLHVEPAQLGDDSSSDSSSSNSSSSDSATIAAVGTAAATIIATVGLAGAGIIATMSAVGIAALLTVSDGDCTGRCACGERTELVKVQCSCGCSLVDFACRTTRAM